jgi:hypothetical protein
LGENEFLEKNNFGGKNKFSGENELGSAIDTVFPISFCA